MDTDWFQEALSKVGMTQADLARHLGLAPSAVSRMLRGERQMKIQEAIETAGLLSVGQDEVIRRAQSAGTSKPSEPARRGRPPRRDTAVPRAAPQWVDLIPIHGDASANSEPVGYTARPPTLAGVRDAYAVYMTGEALVPRYQPGWLLYVHPFRPPIRGRDVVVHKKNSEWLILQFVEQNQKELVLEQLNPKDVLRIPAEQVSSCHLVVGVDQEG